METEASAPTQRLLNFFLWLMYCKRLWGMRVRGGTQAPRLARTQGHVCTCATGHSQQRLTSLPILSSPGVNHHIVMTLWEEQPRTGERLQEEQPRTGEHLALAKRGSTLKHLVLPEIQRSCH